MKWSQLADQPCSVARSVAVIGDRWTLMLLRDAFLGIRRFDDFERRLGISRSIIADRLKHLVDEGVLRREAYQENPVRHEYRLTDKGRDLFPIVVALMDWGDRWALAADGPPVEVRHRDCDGRVHAKLTCEHGHTDLSARDTYGAPGAAPRELAG